MLLTDARQAAACAESSWWTPRVFIGSGRYRNLRPCCYSSAAICCHCLLMLNQDGLHQCVCFTVVCADESLPFNASYRVLTKQAPL